ncbi:LOW QUALITY PROTEIN: pregnancy zone protein-like [Thomomys bottae]
MRTKLPRPALILLFLLLPRDVSPAAKPQYMVVVPSQLYAGVPEKACVHLSHLNETVTLHIVLSYGMGSQSILTKQAVQENSFFCSPFLVSRVGWRERQGWIGVDMYGFRLSPPKNEEENIVEKRWSSRRDFQIRCQETKKHSPQILFHVCCYLSVPVSTYLWVCFRAITGGGLNSGVASCSCSAVSIHSRPVLYHLSHLIPSSPSSSAVLTVQVRGPTHLFTKKKQIQILKVQNPVFVQTDKPMYKPGQTVQFRIVSVDVNFRPLSPTFPLVYVENPKKNQIFQWKNVKLQGGISQLSLPLSPEPTLGPYKVTVLKASGERIEHFFDVNEYVAPKFEVQVKMPKVISFLDEEIKVSVCGLYTYGKPVPGLVKMNVCRNYLQSSSFCQARRIPNICEEFSQQADKKGCVTQVIKTQVFQLRQAAYEMKLHVEATVKEEGTGLELPGYGSCEITTALSKLKFTKVDSHYRRGLPLFGQILLVDDKDQPMPHKSIMLSVLTAGYESTFTTDNDGLVNISINTSNFTFSSAMLQVRRKNHVGKTRGADLTFKSRVHFQSISKIPDWRRDSSGRAPAESKGAEQEGEVLSSGQHAQKKAIQRLTTGMLPPREAEISQPPGALEKHSHQQWPPHVSCSLSHQATYKQNGPPCFDHFVNAVHIQAQHTVKNVFSPSKSYVHLELVLGALPCGRSQQMRAHYVLNQQVLKDEKDLTFYYLLKARGVIVTSGAHTLSPEPGHWEGVFAFTFRVDPELAPAAQLLLYTILPNGEVVADAQKLDIEHCFTNQIHLGFSSTQSLPGSDIHLKIMAAPLSLCALRAVDQSMLLLKPEKELSPQSVYNLLPAKSEVRSPVNAGVGENCIYAEDIIHNGILYTPRLDSSDEDTHSIFESAGFDVFTNSKVHKPQFCQRPFPFGGPYPPWLRRRAIGWLRRWMGPRVPSRLGGWPSLGIHVRKGPPGGATPMSSPGPRSLGALANLQALLRALAHAFFPDVSVVLTQRWRMRSSQVLSPLFLSPKLPTPLKTTIVGWAPGPGARRCPRLPGAPGAALAGGLGAPGVPAAAAGVLGGVPGVPGVPGVGVPGVPGGAGLAAQVQSPPRKYFPETWIWDLVTLDSSGAAELALRVPDAITQWKAGALCLSQGAGLGLSQVMSLRVFQPLFLGLSLPYSVVRGEAFTLKATAYYLPHCIWVRVSLAPQPGVLAEPVGVHAPSSCLCHGERTTLAWAVTPRVGGQVNLTGVLEALQTAAPCGNEAGPPPGPLLPDTVVKTLRVELEGVEREETVNVLSCASDGRMPEKLSLKLPSDVVHGSARATYSVQGDILGGAAMQNLQNLLQMPHGCEQNMILFVPNIFVLNYLNVTGQLTEEIKSRAVGHLVSGYQTQLNFKHSDGSYSTFGDQNGRTPGNTWLTAFVLKSFVHAQPYIFVDSGHITTTFHWLLRKQKENGCFQPSGTLLNNAIKGGVGDEATLSAYVTIALLEMGLPVTHMVVRNAFFCLDMVWRSISQTQASHVYSKALLAYAFALAGDQLKRNWILESLNREAVKEEDSLHWERPRKAPGAETLGYHTSTASAEVEMTCYILLAYLTSPSPGDLSTASRIVKWVIKQQNAHGGFSSTQDTVIALQALSKYGAATFTKNAQATLVTVRSPGVSHDFHVDDTNRLLVQDMSLPEVPGDYSVTVSGSGCVYLQTILRYNILPKKGGKAFFNLGVETLPPSCDKDGEAEKKFELHINISYTGKRPSSNMVIVDVKMVSGFVPERVSTKQLQSRADIQKTEVNTNHVLIYLEKLTSETMGFHFLVEQDVPIKNLQPATVKAYDYYETDEYAIEEYNAPCRAESEQRNA